MTGGFPQPVRVFCSYAHTDRDLRTRLEAHFSVMKDNREIALWTDGDLLAGQSWPAEIRKELDSAEIVLLLISENFFNSWYIAHVELDRALVQHESGAARVIPVILKACDFQNSRVAHLQALPREAKPLYERYRFSNERAVQVVKGIRDVVQEIRGRPEPTAFSVRSVPSTLPFLCDRTRQEIRLESAFEAHQQNAPRRPLVCVVHGDEWELHDGYQLRLQNYSLPRILGTPPDQRLNHVYSLGLPETGSEPLSPGAFLSLLAIVLDCPRAAVMKKLAGHGQPVLLYTEILTSEWPAFGAELVHGFLDFWNRWPDSPANGLILPCLFVKYERSSSGNPPPWRYPGVVEELRAFLTKLDLAKYPNLGAVVLPELNPIELRDARLFASLQPVQKCLPPQHSLFQWNSAIEAYYNGRPSLPMKELNNYLLTMLDRFLGRAS